MLPLPRTRKRFAAPRFDFIFGIKTSFSLTPGGPRLRGDASNSRGYHLSPPYAAAGLADEAFFGSPLRLAAGGLFFFFSRRPLFFGPPTHHPLPPSRLYHSPPSPHPPHPLFPP